MTQTTEKATKLNAAELQEQLHKQFNTHGATMKQADQFLMDKDYDGFLEHYANLPLHTLIEIVQAQHLKINEIFHEMAQRGELNRGIMRDISNCKDFMEFDELRKKARSILLAQDMLDRGADMEKVKKTLEQQHPEKSIIV